MSTSANQQEFPVAATIQSPADCLQELERSIPVLRIEASEGWTSFNLKELWTFRELFYFLTWRDIKLRYKQTELGIAWAILQPLLTMIIFSLFFGRLAKIPSDGIPYPIFAFTALVPWMFFANGLTQASNSLVGNSNLITKVYFPRIMIPISAVLSGAFDFALAFAVLLGMVVYYQMTVTSSIFLLPLFLIQALITALGAGLWFSALNVKYRDVRFVMPFLIQIWMFATPIAYPSSLIPGPWRILYGLNPMVGVIEGFRSMLPGNQAQAGSMIAVSSAVALALLISGALYFKRVEKTFADVV
ncbi:MAG: ABC transporter permease [Acidobacteria bacterium]|nr:ABC transporter permease [Acidobacteriota bacterium]